MSKRERTAVIAAMVYMAVYIPYFLVMVFYVSTHHHEIPHAAIFVPHFFGMALNFLALILTIRDLYRRDFPNPNSKLTWLILILMTGGIGWIVYIFKYALKPRPSEENEKEMV